MFTLLVLLLACYAASMKLESPIINPGPNPDFVEDHNFTLNCSHVKGNVEVELHWSYPNANASYWNKTSEEIDGTSIVSTLLVPKASMKDSGKYTCNATSPNYDPSTATFDIEVQGAPIVKVEGLRDYVLPKKVQKVSCSAQGFPVPSIVWKFKSCVNGSSCSPFEALEDNMANELAPNYTRSRNLIISELTLPIKSPGFLRCIANNTLGTASDTVNVSISKIHGLHIFTLGGVTDSGVSRVYEKMMGDTATLKCGANKLHYKSVNLQGPSNYPIHVGDTDYSWVKELTIWSLPTELEGTYSCIAKKYDNNIEIKNITIKVFEKEAPRFLEDSNMMNNAEFIANENESYFLNCTVTGWPKPNVLWMKDEKPLSRLFPFIDNTNFSDDMQRLELTHVTEQHVGVYTCDATNIMGSIKGILVLSTHDKNTSYIKISSLDMEILINQSDPLEWKADVCSIPRNPQIKYTNWRDDELENNTRIKMEFNQTSLCLTINNITSNDFGPYTLTASIRNATDKVTVFIKVNSAPIVKVEGVPDYLPPEKKLEINCSVQGFPVPSIVGEFQSCSNLSSCSSFEAINDTEPIDPFPNSHTPENLVMRRMLWTPSSSGFLRCLATNDFGTDNHTVKVSLSDMDDLYVFKYNKTKVTASSAFNTLLTNDRFELECGANKLHYNAVMLHTPPNNEGMVNKSDSMYSWRRIVAVQVTKTMEGMYSCIAETDNNGKISENVTISVTEEVPVRFLEDSNMNNETVAIKNNDRYILKCSVTGLPEPTITWKKDKIELTSDSEFIDKETVLLSANSLELKRIKSEHMGVYTCIAENRINKVKGTITLQGADLGTRIDIGLVMFLVVVAILILITTYLFRRIKTERKFRQSHRENALYLFQKGNLCQLNPDASADEQAELLPYNQEWEVDREQITLGKHLGCGAFGRVVKASVTGLEGPAATTVAIKMCKNQADPSQVRALALELKIMNHLGKHLNIVNLMGANTVHIGKGELWILVEYCCFGSLLVFMHRHRRNFINQIDPTTGHIDSSLLSPISPDLNEEGLSTTPDSPLAPQVPPLDNHTTFPQPQTAGMPMVQSPDGGESFHRPFSTTNTADSNSSKSSIIQHITSTTASDGQVHNSHFMSTLGSTSYLTPIGGATANTPFTTNDLVCWSWQVAQGMDYLTSRKVLHGDLALRNLLLAKDNIVKISDFGLSRDIYRKDIYIKKSKDQMPIKWMPIEAIRDRIFSVESDVWAFGVTIWEIFSLGNNPYPDVFIDKDFLELLENGYRMPCPKYANQEIHNLMLECWKADPLYRPSFRQAKNSIEDMMQPDVKDVYINTNNQYVKMNEERFKKDTDYLLMFSSPNYMNMTNITNDDDLKSQNVNIEQDAGGDQVKIESLGVTYSSKTSPGPTSHNNDYLPMNCK